MEIMLKETRLGRQNVEVISQLMGTASFIKDCVTRIL